MPNIFHQSVEDILKAATPEQKILWNDIFLRFGERIAISQFYFCGALVGSELATYVARKMYLALSFSAATVNRGTAVANAASITTYDESNAINFYLHHNSAVWDATAAALRYSGINPKCNNLLFSRVAFSSLELVQFIGYRITY